MVDVEVGGKGFFELDENRAPVRKPTAVEYLIHHLVELRAVREIRTTDVQRFLESRGAARYRQVVECALSH